MILIFFVLAATCLKGLGRIVLKPVMVEKWTAVNYSRLQRLLYKPCAYRIILYHISDVCRVLQLVEGHG